MPNTHMRIRWRAALAAAALLAGCAADPVGHKTRGTVTSDTGTTTTETDCASSDSDLDGVDDCNDVCDGYNDIADHDADAIPDGCDEDLAVCATVEDCDDGLACTVNTCDEDGLCATAPEGQCPWPAEAPGAATNLTSVEGPFLNDFHYNLSGAVWNPVSRQLWVCTNNGSKVWAMSEGGNLGMEIANQNGERGEWSNNDGFGDSEGLTFVDFHQTEMLYVLDEGRATVMQWDFSDYAGNGVLIQEWDLRQWLPGGGSEGITFVPDAFLQGQGFTDKDGQLYTSTMGMGGLMLVGHQGGGLVHAMDLDPASGDALWVGTYFTGANETAGLEFDRSTGSLYIWHGGDAMYLERTRLSSSPVQDGRKLDTVLEYEGPGEVVLVGSENLEGFALVSNDDCADGRRGAFTTTDGGNFWSLLWYQEFPCE